MCFVVTLTLQHSNVGAAAERIVRNSHSENIDELAQIHIMMTFTNHVEGTLLEQCQKHVAGPL